MTLYTPWQDCERCARREYRWGIFSPRAGSPKVLVLSAVASRESQAIGRPDPAAERVADAICRICKLTRAEVHTDVLVACGGSSDVYAHEAAACSQRIHDQATFRRWPLKLVVLIGEYAARLARQAGLLEVSGFLIGGQRVACVVVSDAAEVGLDRAWAALSRKSGVVTGTVLYPSAKHVLMSILHERCTGHAYRPLHGEWQRSTKPPSVTDVDAHVNGDGWLSPFRPVGAWPYVVLDVDLHNAIQSARHKETRRRLRQLFPNSLFFQSSSSGGLHVYVRLPPDTQYPDAAVWLTEFLAQHKLLFHKPAPGLSRSIQGPIAVRLVEVPLHPPRLPFGAGSMLLGVAPKAAVKRFEEWLASTDCSDFIRAKQAVSASAPPRVRWPERAAWARTYVGQLEMQALGDHRPRALAPGDPWVPYLSRLSQDLVLLVSNGCLAFGTRTGTMVRIADGLAELVDPGQARVLFRHWIEHRDHHSDDIHARPADVFDYADRLVDDAFTGRGVPASTWATVEAAIQEQRAARSSPGHGLSVLECRRAAFYILRLFFAAHRGRIPIAAEQFGLALGRHLVGDLPVRRPNQNRVHSVVREMRFLITRTRWPSVRDRRAGEYELQSPYWPPPPAGGTLLYQVPDP